MHPSLRAAYHLGLREVGVVSTPRLSATVGLWNPAVFFSSLVALLVGAGRRETVFRPLGRIQSVWKQRHQETLGCSTLFMSGRGPILDLSSEKFSVAARRATWLSIALSFPGGCGASHQSVGCPALRSPANVYVFGSAGTCICACGFARAGITGSVASCPRGDILQSSGVWRAP